MHRTAGRSPAQGVRLAANRTSDGKTLVVRPLDPTQSSMPPESLGTDPGQVADRQFRPPHGEKGVEVPVIFLTSDISADMETQVLSAGAADFIRKPVNPPMLASRMSNAWAGAGRRSTST